MTELSNSWINLRFRFVVKGRVLISNAHGFSLEDAIRAKLPQHDFGSLQGIDRAGEGWSWVPIADELVKEVIENVRGEHHD